MTFAQIYAHPFIRWTKDFGLFLLYKTFPKNTAKWKILEKQILRLAEIEDACVNVRYLNNGLGGSMVRT